MLEVSRQLVSGLGIRNTSIGGRRGGCQATPEKHTTKLRNKYNKHKTNTTKHNKHRKQRTKHKNTEKN